MARKNILKYVPTPTDGDPDYITKAEVAKLLGVTTRTVDRWVAKRVLPPPMRVGPRLLRWRRQVIHDFMRRLEKRA
jgi:excisionase family DNA binding protein